MAFRQGLRPEYLIRYLAARLRPRSFNAAAYVALAAFAFVILFPASHPMMAQEPTTESAQNQGQTEQPTTLDRTLATLHGMVRNAATGEGLPRALVRIEGDANTGALTDGEGRFEIPNIPVGPQSVSVQKPGFVDNFFSAVGATNEMEQFLPAMATGGHNVLVAVQMPDVVFTLAPTGAIRGQVELSTGEPAAGIAITLAQRTVADGRAIWQQESSTKTRGDGTFRFGGLADGDYAIFSEPTMDSDLDRMSGGAGQRWGYASAYYPDARDPSGAGKIRVANGQETQVNLALTLEPFQTVTAAVVFPQGSAAERAGLSFSVAVMDGAGHQLPYQAQYDEQSHLVQAQLPDGSYTLLMSSVPRGTGGAEQRNARVLAGSVDVTVAGHAVPNLRLALSVPRPNPVQVIVQRNAGPAMSGGQISVLVSAAGGWIDDSMISDYANGAVSGALEAIYNRPGTYWVHTHSPIGLCVAAFTAGGANLAREPVVIGLSGSTAPMEVTVRADCASLDLMLPETLASVTAGDEPLFTVYVVPDFDSTVDVDPQFLRASTGGNATLSGLAPGDYHVYTFVGAVQLEYRNRAALAALANHAQAITLSPGATSNLVVEAGQ